MSYKDKLEIIGKVLPEVSDLMERELGDQRTNLKMIASENYCSPAVREAMSSLFTDKYSEGYPYHRYYEGCDNVDELESLAALMAEELFGADYAFVQPHCGSDANLLAYWAILDSKVLGPAFEDLKRSCNLSLGGREVKTYGDLTLGEWEYLRTICRSQKMLSMDYHSGSHLTHGYRNNVSGQMFECHYYSVGDDGLLDYEDIRKKALEVRPLILLAGYSAYPRKIDFKKFREIADEVGAVLMVDMAHFAGLVAGKVYEGDFDPVKWADVVTSTTHKTLRGPRGGLVLCKEWLKDSVNKACPLVMGGALQNLIASKAVCFKEALSPSFQDYASQIVSNAKKLSEVLVREGLGVVSGGTDNHLVLVDVSPLGITGRQAERALKDCGITCNRNTVPRDKESPFITSGIRLGVPALTTLGMKEPQMETIGGLISLVLKRSVPGVTPKGSKSKIKVSVPPEVLEEVKGKVLELLEEFPPYPDLI